MTEYEKLIQEDKTIKTILKETQIKLQAKGFTDRVQEENTRKGKPMPALTMGYFVQNTSKQVNRLNEKQRKATLRIIEDTEKRIETREVEIRKANPEKYQEHLIEKQKQRFKENQHLLNKENER